jgi:predicted HTH domain antitoxin
MCNIVIEVPEELLLNLHKNKEDFESYAKLCIAVDLYKSGNVSLGYCTAVAGIDKRDFIKEIGKRNISIFNFESEEAFMEDVSNA